MNSKKQIHIIAFDIPYPADYGGVIDIFYKLKSLHKQGYMIDLHCFEYGRSHSDFLKSYCKHVYYYKRKTLMNPFIGKLPYIVDSRENTLLLEHLKSNHAPILFEGLHTCFYLNHPELKHRFKIVRTHNVEHDYYKHLERIETNFFKKYFFKIESEKLKKYQNILKEANLIAAISPSDYEYFKKKYDNTIYLKAFHPNASLEINNNNTKAYILFHGNLSVGENHEAALFLSNQVFSKIPNIKCIIAGNNPKSELLKAVKAFTNIEIKDKISVEEIDVLIKEARLNILFTKQNTGIKLKLLNVLFKGNCIIANTEMVENTGLEQLCIVANTANDYLQLINEHFVKSISNESIVFRNEILNQMFNNDKNILELTKCIP